MKVLLTSNLKGPNTLIDGLYHGLSQVMEIQACVDGFWDTKTSNFYNIVHIQWPEQLFAWKSIDNEDLKKLTNQLIFWKNRGSKIVVTRHNILPHNINGLYKEAYEIIYNKADAIIHFSEASVKNFNLMYVNSQIDLKIIHKVIFHPMYTDILNNCSQNEARRHLKIAKKSKVILIFGSIRSDKERNFALKVFDNLQVKDKLLLAPSWFSTPPSKNKISKRLFELKSIINIFSFNKRLQRKFIPDDEIQIYMNAADIVFLPRFEVLNSGVLVMAYTFNKMVVGPNVGSIGELLNLSNNPSFKVGDINEATSKIMQIINNPSENVTNRQFADEHMSWDIVIKQHIELYKDIAK